MKISYNWLQEYFDKPLPDPKELADLLNIRAFEVEEIEEHDDDSVFEIKITPDRAPDCLSHLGVAREVGLHTGLALREPAVEPITPSFETSVAVMAQEGSLIRYMAREVRNVRVVESPLELKKKLEAIGQRSINTVVDITNLVMYEIGQPMHAFDTERLSGSVIRIGEPVEPTMTTLDGKEVELTAEDLTVQDGESNLAIAGVKGGKKAEVGSYTKDILLEAANFFPVRVRKTAKRTGIQTDSSKRFENGLSAKLAEKAMALASQYVRQYASKEDTEFSNIIDVYPRPQTRPYAVGLYLPNIEKKLGVRVPEERVLAILNTLGIAARKVEKREELQDWISETIGTPYLLGSSVLFDSPNIFDCSSLTAYLYGRIGVQIPRMTIDQWAFGKRIEGEDLAFGDLVFSNGEDGHVHLESKEFLPGTRCEEGIDHVGMYLGEGKVLHASRYNEKGTTIEDLDAARQFKNAVAYARIEAEFPRYVLEIPYERLDLKTEIDIIEEIGRTYGYEHIDPVAPARIVQEGGLSTYDRIATFKSYLADFGFDEVVTYSFRKKGDVSVVKPIAKDKGYLRTDLAKGLDEALELNFRNRELFAEDVIRIFEVGHVFSGERERTLLGIAVRSSVKKQKAEAVVREAAAYLEEKTGIQLPVAQMTVSEQGAITSAVAEIELDGVYESITVAHNTLHALGDRAYRPYSPYPFMTRDLAVWAKGGKNRADVERIIADLGTELLLRSDLFDTYAADGRTSYAYRLVFQSFDRTLTDDEVNPIMDAIYAALQADADFEIR